MNKHIIWIFAFLLLAFLGDRLGGFILKHITQSSQFRYSRLYYGNEDADILFVGNSRGLTFFQPEVERITGMSTMNLSYNGMPADLAKTLVMDYLDKHKAPKIMIVDVTLCDRENEVLKNGFNVYSSESQRLTDLIKANVGTHRPKETEMKVDTLDVLAGKKVYYGGLVSQLYRHNSEVFQRVLYYKNRTDEDWLIDRVINEKAATSDKDLTSYPVRMFPHMVTHLKEMIDYAKAKGVDVRLVINPYLPAFAETKSIRDTFLMPLKSFVESQTGMPIRDYSTALKERDDIGDYQHANKKGSTKYMNILAQDGLFNPLTVISLGDNGSYPIEYPMSENINVSPRLEDISEVEDHSKIKQNIAPTPIAQAPPQYSVAQTTNSAVLETQNLSAVDTKKQAVAQPNKLADAGEKKATYKILRKKHAKKKVKKKYAKNRHQKEEDEDWISVDSAF
jgi:hypothetical protein